MDYIYILKLENNKWYVGFTRNIKQRLHKHLNTKSGGQSKGKWTRYNKAISAKYSGPGSRNLEDELTLVYMQKYGINNVRGGKWVNSILKYKQVQQLNSILEVRQQARQIVNNNY